MPKKIKNIIELKKVNKSYKIDKKEVKKLINVDLKIREGDIVVISGPSGSGKSTLLNLIGGLDTLSSGTILIDEVDISEYNEKEFAKIRANDISYIFQSGNVFPTLTVKENIEIVSSVTKEDFDLEEILKKVKLEKQKGKFFHQLTALEQQKVAVARAFAKNSKILLCDEPTGDTNTKETIELLKLLKEYRGKTKDKDKRTVVIATHNQAYEDMADSVVKIKDGKIIKVLRNRKKKLPEDVA